MSSTTPQTFVGSTTFQVDGMTCAHCERAVTDHIGRVAGVAHVAVSLPTGAVTVVARTPVDRADVGAAVQDAGYSLRD